MLHSAPLPQNSIDVVRWRLDLLDECPQPLGCDECQYLYCLLADALPSETYLGPPLYWRREQFETLPPVTSATDTTLLSLKLTGSVLRMNLREGTWEVKAVGAAEVLKRRCPGADCQSTPS